MTRPPPAHRPLTRRAIGACAAAVAAAPAAACGAGGGRGDTAPAAALKPGTTIQWLLQAATGPNLEADTRAATTFEQQYAAQNLKVDRQQSLTGKDYSDKRTALFASGDVPHIIWTLPADVPAFQSRTLLLNLSSYMKRDKLDLSDFFAAGWDSFRYAAPGKPGTPASANDAVPSISAGGDLFGAPKDVPSRAVAFNADAFAEVGAKPPAATFAESGWTWPTFLEVAQKVTKRGDGPNGVSRWGWHGHETLHEWLPWVFNNGGELVSADGKESRWDHPKTVEAFQFLADLQQRHKVAPTPQQRAAEPPMDQQFFTGKLGMMHFGPANLGRYRTSIQGFTWDVAVWPRGGAPGTAIGSGSGWMVPASTKDPDAAWLFVQHLVGPAVQRGNAEAGSGVPARRSVMDQVFARQPAPPKNVRVFEANARTARIVPPILRWTEMMVEVDRLLPALWAGERTARDVCTEIKRLTDPILKS
jgi:multiple sugar transport system substrate-binding protein